MSNRVSSLLFFFLVGICAFAQNDRDHIRRGNRLMRDTLYAKAQVEYQKAIEADNTNATAHYNLANVLMCQNKLKEAKEMLMKAKKFSEFLDKLSGGWACGPPSLDFNLDINASQSTCYCCGGKVVDGFNVNLPLLSGSYSVDCAFPLPSLSIPCIGGLYVAGGGTFSISLGPMAMRFRGYCSQMDIPVDLGGEGVYIKQPLE